jgi:hypothetical protein
MDKSETENRFYPRFKRLGIIHISVALFASLMMVATGKLEPGPIIPIAILIGYIHPLTGKLLDKIFS